ncbi:hypothetical protein R3P38DRAFT_2617176 [Favolaschia claudopus]|uniref:TEA domain-containing protein n=1 Tax=Favolaschia claudopus TaxID=2862362 RepID=A0AAW0C9B6_9AGAR
MVCTGFQGVINKVLVYLIYRYPIGLEKYQPNHSHQSLRLGRFCGRNRFISDYIFNKTGRRRSNKQVATRLGQLKEWSGECQAQRRLKTQTLKAMQIEVRAPLNNSFETAQADGWTVRY